MIHLSFSGFLAIYGPFTGLVGVGRFPNPWFRLYLCFRTYRISAPKEHGRSGTVIIRAIATFLRINHTSPAKWAWVVVNCKNFRWHLSEMFDYKVCCLCLCFEMFVNGFPFHKRQLESPFNHIQTFLNFNDSCFFFHIKTILRPLNHISVV